MVLCNHLESMNPCQRQYPARSGLRDWGAYRLFATQVHRFFSLLAMNVEQYSKYFVPISCSSISDGVVG